VPYPQREFLLAARDAAAAIRPSPSDIAALAGPQIAAELQRRRLTAIADVRGRFQRGP